MHAGHFSFSFCAIAWIALASGMAGCSYNTEQPCSDRTATYNASVAAIFNAQCEGCLGGENPEAGLALDNYPSSVDAVLSGDVIDRITRETDDALVMPPNGSFQICDIALIEQWAEAGAPE
jgi:hypothetical protein